MAKRKSGLSAKAANEMIAKEGEGNQRKSADVKARAPRSGAKAGNQSGGGARNAASRGHNED